LRESSILIISDEHVFDVCDRMSSRVLQKEYFFVARFNVIALREYFSVRLRVGYNPLFIFTYMADWAY